MHDDWNRNETKAQRLDRNWMQLLQELRVLQQAVQLLTGFLLILPFQSGFKNLDSAMVVVYAVTVTAAISSTLFAIAPVSWHRILFRQKKMHSVVSIAQVCSLVALLLLGLALTSVTILVTDAMLGHTAGFVAGGISALLFSTIWIIIPLTSRFKD